VTAPRSAPLSPLLRLRVRGQTTVTNGLGTPMTPRRQIMARGEKEICHDDALGLHCSKATLGPAGGADYGLWELWIRRMRWGDSAWTPSTFHLRAWPSPPPN
jgi:hypothetical protein